MKYSRALSSVNVSSVGSWVTTGLEGEGESEGEKGREAGSKEKGRKEGREEGREGGGGGGSIRWVYSTLWDTTVE